MLNLYLQWIVWNDITNLTLESIFLYLSSKNEINTCLLLFILIKFKTISDKTN